MTETVIEKIVDILKDACEDHLDGSSKVGMYDLETNEKIVDCIFNRTKAVNDLVALVESVVESVRREAHEEGVKDGLSKKLNDIGVDLVIAVLKQNKEFMYKLGASAAEAYISQQESSSEKGDHD